MQTSAIKSFPNCQTATFALRNQNRTINVTDTYEKKHRVEDDIEWYTWRKEESVKIVRRVRSFHGSKCFETKIWNEKLRNKKCRCEQALTFPSKPERALIPGEVEELAAIVDLLGIRLDIV